MIYMDNAATTMQKPPQVADAVVRAMGTIGNAGRGASEASLSAARIIYETREQLCRLFHGEDPTTDRIYIECNRKFEHGNLWHDRSGRSCDHYGDGTQFRTPSVICL